MADGTPVTATVGNGGLTPSVLGAVEEWLAFNASVRQAGERKGRLSSSSRGGLERGGDAGRGRGSRWEPSSETEITRWSEGGADGLRTGLLLVLSFFPDWKKVVGLRGLSCLICVCVFRVILVPRLGCP